MKILIAVLVAVGLYFTFLHNNTFKSSFSFAGDDYSHSQTKGGGDFKNHFYTIGDTDLIGSRQLVQIVEFPEGLLPEQYEYYTKPLFDRYKLERVGRDPLVRVGAFEQTGLKFKSYSSKIVLENRTHIVFYLTTIDERRSNKQILTDLAKIEFD